MVKKYQVFTVTNTRTKEISSFEVNCAETVDESNKIPAAAVFPVSVRYDERKQRKRAAKYAEYLNKLAEMANDLEEGQAI